ncbi:hypothetical protein [Actinoplanes sp. L3-i22]|uniref:hypothetical protein n=1 Tax=Actinoplanes sp. L3-i22 TaxID=2836373 RepID=UPI001C755A25|nr:hypothetical protein [Actinoplanes sp. L3-i22]BCY10047.1 hypothetical protein L3i22_051350 [Actinoplanes sp. L3-i22]
MRLTAGLITAGIVLTASPVWAGPGPHYTPGTVYFTKTESAELTYPAGVAAVQAVVAKPFDRLLGQNTAEIMVKASSANIVGQCVKITSTGVIGTYGGGTCQ